MAAVTLGLLVGTPANAQEAHKLDTYPAKPFPDLSFIDDKGTSHTLKDEKGKLTLVHFWATWCVPCVSEFPQIDAVQNTYGGSGLKVIAISLDGEHNIKKVNDFYKSHTITHVSAYVDNGSAVKEAKLVGMPTTYFINAEGKAIATATGSLDWSSAETKSLIEKNLK